MENIIISSSQDKAKKLSDFLTSDKKCVVRLGGVRSISDVDIEINSSEAVRNCIDKFKAKKILAEAGIPQMPTLHEHEISYPCIVKGIVRSKGSAVFLAEDFHDLHCFRKHLKQQCYVEPMFSATSEYRIHATSDKVFFAVKKVKDEEAKNDVIITAKNHRNTRDFLKPRLWKDMQEAAILAVKTLGLDIGAVDIGYNSTGNHSFVIHEVNTNPELLKNTFEAYVTEIQQLINQKTK